MFKSYRDGFAGWLYTWLYLWVDLLCSIIGILTLCIWRPSWAFDFVFWYEMELAPRLRRKP
jgi:hypothetical protein